MLKYINYIETVVKYEFGVWLSQKKTKPFFSGVIFVEFCWLDLMAAMFSNPDSPVSVRKTKLYHYH